MNDHLRYAAEWTAWALEQRKRWRADAPDYALIVIGPDLPALPPRRPAWQRLLLPTPDTLQDIAQALGDVERDPRTRGAVLHFRRLDMSWPMVEAVRSMIADLRSSGKEVVAWASHYDTAAYYAAVACDRLLLQPGGNIQPLGLRRPYVFLADGLEHLGLRFEPVRVSPYKTAPDMLARRDMSAEAREMAEWLIDAAFDELVAAVAEGRGLDDDAAREVIDGAPYTDRAAVEAGLVDEVVSEEALPALLGSRSGPATVERWHDARPHVISEPPARPGSHVALLRIEGPIVDGESSHPPTRPVPGPALLSGARAGDLTVVQEVRKAAEDDDVAAVVLWVDSPGGSATASEAIAAALEELARRKPLVAAMGSVAGSGGYYVTTPAREVFAQPSTLTGSIGVVAGKLVIEGLLDRLRVHREILRRGDGMTLFDPERPLDERERAIIEEEIQRVYDVFLQRVQDGRHMDRADLEPLAGGRVWTGRQAQEHGLVDHLGGLEDAVERARELASLGRRTGRREIILQRDRLGPLVQMAPAATLDVALDTVRSLAGHRVLCLMPWVRGS